MACHEADQNECPYQPAIRQMIHNVEERHKRDLKILILVLSIIMAVGVFQVMTTSTTATKNQEITAVKEEFRREMEKMEKSMNEEFKKKDQEIAAIKEEIRKQVDREEQVTEKKLAKQKKVCCNIICST